MFTSTLEEVRLLKEQEQDQTRYLRQIIPQLEPPYMKLLEEWEIAFAEMVKRAGEKTAKDSRVSNDEITNHAEEKGIAVDRYIHLANEQSNEFVVHLRQLKADSSVIEANPEACEAIDQVIHGIWYIKH